MLKHAKAIQDAVRGLGLEEYLANEDLRLVIDRRLEIIGEASKRVSEVFKQAHTEVPWAGIQGLRNVLAHEYDAIDYHRVWGVVSKYVPAMTAQLESLVPPAPPDPEPER
jgi:uncharacterized protein with HEPN domain